MAKNNILYFDSDEEAIRVLKAEGKKLKKCAVKVWRMYLESYTPSVYAEHITGVAGKRTGKSLKSIKLGNVKKLDGDDWGIELTFVDELAYHDSVMGNSQPKGHAIMLISSGWKVKRGNHKDVYRFGYFEGFDYLGQVKKMYNEMKDKRITLDIQWSGSKDYTKR